MAPLYHHMSLERMVSFGRWQLTITKNQMNLSIELESLELVILASSWNVSRLEW